MPEAIAAGPLLLPTLRLTVVGSLLLAIAAATALAAPCGASRRWVRWSADGAVLIGLAAARAGFVAAHWSAYAAAPWTALYFWQPGYAPWIGVGAGCAWVALRLGWRESARLAHALPLAGGFSLAAVLTLGVYIAMLVPRDELVLRPGSRMPGPTLQSLLGDEVRQRHAGDRVPDFEMRDLTGARVRFAALRGRVVVLNFWATWCAPCRREVPLLHEVHAAMTPRGVTVLGVAVGEPAARVAAFMGELGASYPVWVDGPGERASEALFRRFGGVGFPTTFFIDRAGAIRDVYVGELARAPLLAGIEALLGEDG